MKKLFYEGGPDKIKLAGIMFVRGIPQEVPDDIAIQLIKKGRAMEYQEKSQDEDKLDTFYETAQKIDNILEKVDKKKKY